MSFNKFRFILGKKIEEDKTIYQKLSVKKKRKFEQNIVSHGLLFLPPVSCIDEWSSGDCSIGHARFVEDRDHVYVCTNTNPLCFNPL